jgi:hypothetical protein
MTNSEWAEIIELVEQPDMPATGVENVRLPRATDELMSPMGTKRTLTLIAVDASCEQIPGQMRWFVECQGFVFSVSTKVAAASSDLIRGAGSPLSVKFCSSVPFPIIAGWLILLAIPGR